MPRAKLPEPSDLIVALRRTNADLTNYVGIQAERRLYDRASGNFKAVGWICLVYYLRRDPGQPTEEIRREIAILDEYLPAMSQTRFD